MELFSLSGKVVVITGAAGLLGRNHVLAVVAAGGIPVLIDIDKHRLQVVADEVAKTYGETVKMFVVDITNEAQVKSCCESVIKNFGHVDGLVNNAANNPKIESAEINEQSRLENFSLLNWDADISVGLTGAFLCTKYFGAAIASQGGSIVNISSDLGVIAPDQRIYQQPGVAESQQPVKSVTYSVVKTGLIGLSRYTATYWAKQGVRCNALCPGGVENLQDPSFVSKLSSLIPLSRMAHQDEYQGSVIFLLSDASSYMTGSVLIVDGGRTAW
ncbi:MAG: SDR family oxidoreductase [Acidimicrobiaceae bacterium]|nr:SDR family oxidoreductase [Acidimicrobiaceae bacterium]